MAEDKKEKTIFDVLRENEALDKKNKELYKQNKELGRKVSGLNGSELDEAHETIHDLRKDLEKEKSYNKTYVSKITRLVDKNEDLEKEAKDLRNVNAEIATEYYKVFEELKVKNDKLVEENERLKEAYDKLHTNHFTVYQNTVSKGIADELKKENEALKQKLGEALFINKDGEIEDKSDYNKKLDKIIEIMESTFRELGFIYQAIKEVK